MGRGDSIGTPNIDRFAVVLPSFLWDGDGPKGVRRIVDFAGEVEDLGFKSIFITDHLLAARDFYSVSLMEPLTNLASVVAVTKQVRLGTSVLVLPIREPLFR